MPWITLLIAGLFEVGWAVGMKYTDGFTKLWPTVFTIISIVLSMALLGVAVRSLPLGTAYAIWTGVGIVGTAIVEIVWMGQDASLMRIACLGLIVIGMAGLKLTIHT